MFKLIINSSMGGGDSACHGSIYGSKLWLWWLECECVEAFLVGVVRVELWGLRYWRFRWHYFEFSWQSQPTREHETERERERCGGKANGRGKQEWKDSWSPFKVQKEWEKGVVNLFFLWYKWYFIKLWGVRFEFRGRMESTSALTNLVKPIFAVEKNLNAKLLLLFVQFI